MNNRTCVICKKKAQTISLCRFVLLDEEIVFDLKHKIHSYGYYFCKDSFDCLNRLPKWATKKKKLRYIKSDFEGNNDNGS